MTIEELKAENARLKTEVQHLMVFCNCTLIPNKELQAENARLKAEVEHLTWLKVETLNERNKAEAEVERLTKALAFSNSIAKDLYGMLDLRMFKKDLIGIGFTRKQADEEWEAYRTAANAAKESKTK
jgi:cell division protein FtsB